METRTYHSIDKSAWPTGEWQNEPDKMQWPDPATGLPCLANRHPRMGFWCGYVGVAPGHPLHGKGYNDAKNADGEYIDVHGGLTFADGCREKASEESGICHVPGPGEPADVWWFGFDCGHAGDQTDMGCAHLYPSYPHIDDDVYRDLNYVREQCALLAKQLATI